LCDDLLKALYHHEDRQCQMSDAVVMTGAIIAMLYFRGNFEAARRFLRDQGYIHGLKLHLMVTEQGQPVEFFLTPGSYSDTSAMKWYQFDLPEGAWVTGDKAYTDYTLEDLFQDAQRSLLPLRKSNSKRPVKPWVHYLQASYRKVIETTGSLIERLLPKSIHAVTARGFELKIAIFVLACSINYLFR
jgi:hypothetical protein